MRRVVIAFIVALSGCAAPRQIEGTYVIGADEVVLEARFLDVRGVSPSVFSRKSRSEPVDVFRKLMPLSSPAGALEALDVPPDASISVTRYEPIETDAGVELRFTARLPRRFFEQCLAKNAESLGCRLAPFKRSDGGLELAEGFLGRVYVVGGRVPSRWPANAGLLSVSVSIDDALQAEFGELATVAALLHPEAPAIAAWMTEVENTTSVAELTARVRARPRPSDARLRSLVESFVWVRRSEVLDLASGRESPCAAFAAGSDSCGEVIRLRREAGIKPKQPSAAQRALARAADVHEADSKAAFATMCRSKDTVVRQYCEFLLAP